MNLIRYDHTTPRCIFRNGKAWQLYCRGFAEIFTFLNDILDIRDESIELTHRHPLDRFQVNAVGMRYQRDEKLPVYDPFPVESSDGSFDVSVSSSPWN